LGLIALNVVDIITVDAAAAAAAVVVVVVVVVSLIVSFKLVSFVFGEVTVGALLASSNILAGKIISPASL
jgi:hypothetical protein